MIQSVFDLGGPNSSDFASFAMQSFIVPLLAYLVVGLGVALLTLVVDACLRVQKKWGYDGTLRMPSMLVGNALFWPLVVVVAFVAAYMMMQGYLLQKRRSAVRVNPPHCSNTLMYRAAAHRAGGGRFSMKAEHVEILANLRLPKLYSRGREVEELMLIWLASRDPLETAPVEALEVLLPNIQHLLYELCRMGAASMECPDCSASYTVADVSFFDREDSCGRNYAHIQCPEGHALLKLPLGRSFRRDV